MSQSIDRLSVTPTHHRKGQFKSECIFDDEGRECAKCKKYQLWREFHKSPRGAEGRSSSCKTCKSTAKPPKEKVERRKGTIQDDCDSSWNGVSAAMFLSRG